MAHFVRKFGLLQIAGWTVMLAIMLGITLYVHRQDTLKEALLEARNYYRLNYHYRAWNAEIGGLYAPVEKVAPNPYLTAPNRDIATTDQRQLTLVNPSYMSRMVFNRVIADSALPLIGRLTSLAPLNPVNIPDAWERESLLAFERTGSTERFQYLPLNGSPYLRLISRLVTEQSCLKCHESQGYMLGDIRGGISISVPLTPYFIAETKTRNTITGGYLLLWFSGGSVLTLVARKRHEQAAALEKEAVERQAAQEQLQEQAALLEEEITERRRASDELRKSEGRYRLLLESVTNYIYTTLVEDGRVMATSHGPGCTAVTGYSAAEYAADPGLWLRMVPEEDRQVVLEQAGRILDRREITPLEHRIVHKDGEIRWLRNSQVPYFDTEGNLIAYDGIVSDITARKEAEAVITKWKLNLESAQRIAHIGSWELSLEKNELIWSDEIYRIFGLLPQEFSATYESFLATIHPDDRDYVNAAYLRSVEEGIPYDIVHRIIRVSDGEIRYVHEICEHTRNESGRVVRSLGTVHDITERRLAEDALRKEKEFLGNLLQGSAIATFVLDPQHRVLLWNRACEELTGVTAADVVGTSLHWRAFYSIERPCLADIIIEGGTEQLQQMYEQVSRSTLNQEGLQAEGRYPELNGSERYILFNAAPIRNSSGMLLGAIETIQDITGHKALEAQLFQAQKMEAVGQLAGGIAHDFNNILTAIIGFSTLIEMHMAKDDPQRSNLSNVLAAADRASDLTRSLLTFSRKKAIHPQPVDINQIIRRIDTFLKRIISEDIELRTTFQQETVTVDADSCQIELVLMNLATNARDAMPGGGLLSIETGMIEVDSGYIGTHGYGEPGWYACISVSDSGEGMDEATCKKVFEPFFTTKEVGKGTGLGLSVVFGIIKQHNGFINVYSEPGTGTTFRILLPLIQPDVVEEHSITEEIVERGVETILVADDDVLIRELTEKTFRMFGYTVITAVNGSDALIKFRENKDTIDLVIMDIIMPEMNGKEAFDEMKKIDPAVKAIFISGYTGDIIRKQGLLVQGLELFAKPLNIKQLLIKVRTVLGRKI